VLRRLALVFLCLLGFASVSVAGKVDAISLSIRKDIAKENQGNLQNAYATVRNAHFPKAKPIALSGDKGALTKVEAQSFLAQAQTQFSKLVKKWLGKRNSPPNTPDFYGFTDKNFPGGYHTFSTADAISDSDGEITSVEWDFGDGTKIHMPRNECNDFATIEHAFTSTGSYNVHLRVFDDSGNSSEALNTITVSENMAPTPKFSYSTSGTTADFTGIANDPENSVANFHWDFGDGAYEDHSDTNLATHVYSTGGHYTVGLVVDDTNGGSVYFARDVYVDMSIPTSASPVALATLSEVVGETPLSVDFDATLSEDASGGSISTYEWDFGDYESVANQSSNAISTHVYKSSGSYYARLSVWDSNGNRSDSYYNILVSAPNAAGMTGIIARKDGGSRTVHFGNDSRFVGVPTILSDYYWNFGDKNTYEGGSPDHTYAVDGDYPVTLIAHDITGVRHIFISTIHVSNDDNMPEAHLTSNKTYVAPDEEVSFDASGSSDPQQNQPLVYTWNFGDGNIVTGSDKAIVTHRYANRGYFPVKLYVRNSRGFVQDNKTDIMVQAEAHTESRFIFSPKIGTAPFTTDFDMGPSFSDGSSIDSYLWQLDDGTYSTASTFSKTFSDPGFYNVNLYAVDALGNESVMSRQVIVLDGGSIPGGNTSPTGNFVIEYGGPDAGDLHFRVVDANDSDGWLPFLDWTVDTSLQVDGYDLFTNLSTGPHTIALHIVDNWGATTAVSKTIVIGSSKTPDLQYSLSPSSPTALSSVQFDGTGSTVTAIDLSQLRWDFGDGNFAQGAVVNHVYAAAGTYSLVLSVIALDGNNYTYSDSIVVGP